MRLFVAAALAACFVAPATWAQTPCPITTSGQCSAPVGSTPVTLTNGNSRRYQRIVNNSTGDTLDCTRDPKVTPTVNGIGTFPIGPGSAEEYSQNTTGYVPPAPTTCVSTGTATPVAVEVN